MAKYLIEDNVDFYKILHESFTENNNHHEEQECLISKAPLTDHSIRMDCGHTFNYLPLYNEITIQKFRPNNYTNNKYVLQCPYCRTGHSSLLPYYSELCVPLVYGVNSDDMFYKMVVDNRTKKLVYENTLHYFLNGQCCYQHAYVDAELELHISPCQNTCVIVHAETNKTYCSLHIQGAKKQYIIEQKEKVKEEKQKKKEEEKQKWKEEKLNLKEATKNLMRCSYILTTGVNKGIQCKNKQCENNLCKKHLPKTIQNISI